MIRYVASIVVCLAFLATYATPARALFENKFEEEADLEEVAVDLVHQSQQGGYNVVSAEELMGWMQNGKEMVIVDTMPFAESYAKEHVPGAKQFLFPIPLMTEWNSAETDGKSMADFEALLGPDKGKTVVIYCGFVKCTRSHNGALWAKKAGYTDVYRFPGGIFAWKGKEYPVENLE